MLKIKKNSVVYVLCPSMVKTGGTELAHQLVYHINKLGGTAQIAYYNDRGEKLQINEAFKCYTADFVDAANIKDVSENVIVIPEYCPSFLKKYRYVQKCIWWMSVDNYLKYNSITFSVKTYGILYDKHRLLSALYNTIFPVKIKSPSVVHFYQSEYARDFLEKSGVTNVYRLSDYLNEEYLNVDINTERKNVVLFNPKKGFKFTEKLIEAAPDITWIPLQNMTTEQVKDTLLHSKVYIDFGNHPGKDRFPRESAMCGCCVITGKRGSAKFFEDVAIANEFKFDENRRSINKIIDKIKCCLDDYSNQSKKFDGYREFIKGEYKVFQEDVKKIFQLEGCSN